MAFSETKQTARIIDANLNRIGEGLRLLEDIARLLLNDAGLTQQLKAMRHEILESNLSFQQQLIQSRNSEGDVGIDIDVPGGKKQRELPVTVVANSRRVQESLRVLEELAKAPGIELDSERLKHARFDLYTIEQKLLSRLLRQDKLKFLSGLYIIIDIQALQGRSPIEVATQVIRGGARAIQLSNKPENISESLPIAQQLKSLCTEHRVLFIVNNRLDLALAADADGLHLEQEDLPIPVARKLLPIDKILGCSVWTADQATAAKDEGADYIALSLEMLRQLRQAVTLPLVAIGDIDKENIAEVIAAGADSVAIASEILQAEDIEKATRELAEALQQKDG